jgi:hypothetical protein
MLPVVLNVGGSIFTTTRATLAKFVFLDTLLSTDVGVVKLDNVVFIDRDPDLFAILLRYARTSQFVFDPPWTLDVILSEARFYQMELDADRVLDKAVMLPGVRFAHIDVARGSRVVLLHSESGTTRIEDPPARQGAPSYFDAKKYRELAPSDVSLLLPRAGSSSMPSFNTMLNFYLQKERQGYWDILHLEFKQSQSYGGGIEKVSLVLAVPGTKMIHEPWVDQLFCLSTIPTTYPFHFIGNLSNLPIGGNDAPFEELSTRLRNKKASSPNEQSAPFRDSFEKFNLVLEVAAENGWKNFGFQMPFLLLGVVAP